MFEKLLSLLERIAIALEAKQPVVTSGFIAPAAHPTLPPVATSGFIAPTNDFMAVAQAAAAPEQKEEPKVTREQLGKAMLDLANGDPATGRDKLIAALALVGAKKFGEVKEADYNKLFDAIKKAAA